MQLDALKKEGCEILFVEKISGVADNREEFLKMLSMLLKRDTVVVWDIYRLGRKALEIIQLAEDFKKRGINFLSIQERFIDTTNEYGELIFKLMSLLAEMERNRIVRRTRVGLVAARARGRIGGRPKGLNDKAKEKAKAAAQMYKARTMTTEQICSVLKIGSNTTLYKYLRYEGIEINGWINTPIII
jgi:DNA invertase Pin-like site-specific DNA recombinase